MNPAVILVVEDEPLVAADLAALVDSLGYDVAGPAASADAALRIAGDTHVDLALMDIRLKGPTDGISTAETLRARHRIPVVYLTAHTDTGTLDRAQRTEPLGYLAKPFTERDLRVSLSVAIFRARMERQREDEARWATGALAVLADGVLAVDLDARIRFMNRVAEGFTGERWSRAQLRRLDEVLSLPGNRSWRETVAGLVEGEPYLAEARPTSGGSAFFNASVVPLSHATARVGAVVTLRAATPVPPLGVTNPAPICAGCKRIRLEDGHWTELETFLLQRHRLLFSHGLCDNCIRDLYPSMAR